MRHKDLELIFPKCGSGYFNITCPGCGNERMEFWGYIDGETVRVVCGLCYKMVLDYCDDDITFVWDSHTQHTIKRRRDD